MSRKPRTPRRRRPPRPRRVSRAAPAATTTAADPFRHVVLLLLENRSFDHMLGALQAVLPDVDGVPPNGPPRVNRDNAGAEYQQLPFRTRRIEPDPGHETPNVRVQLKDNNGGFVLDFSDTHPDSSAAQRAQVMGYYQRRDVTALHTLAEQFAVCDAWFCPVPGPTWTNRLFAMSGTSQGRVKMPQGIFQPNFHRYSQPSVFRRLGEAGRSWRVYHGDFPLALLLEDQRTGGMENYWPMRWFARHAKGPADQFPEFAFIEPDYLWPTTNDDHPPHDIRDGQRLIAEIYNAIRANDELWRSTVLVITYDEHGGFYDHVVPPGAIPPDGHTEEYTFDQYGVRVPAVVVSPWLPQQVCKTRLDHTSLLKSLSERWGLGAMGARAAGANDLLQSLTQASEMRTNTPRRLAAGPAAATARVARAAPPQELSDNQQAIVAFSQYLEMQTPQTARAAAPAVASRMARSMRSPADACQVARERSRNFLRSRGARV